MAGFWVDPPSRGAKCPSLFLFQAQRGRRLPRKRDSRPAAGAIPGDQHRPHQLLPCQTLQHLVGGRHQAERQRRHGLRVPLQDVRRHDRLLRQNQRGEHQEQLRAHLRVAGRWVARARARARTCPTRPQFIAHLICSCVCRDPGLWVPTEFRDRRSEDLHHPAGH